MRVFLPSPNYALVTLTRTDPLNNIKQKRVTRDAVVVVVVGDARYAHRKFDHDYGKSHPEVAVRDIDFAGGFRTPFVTLQSAYFRRVQPQTNFMVAGPTAVDMYV